jgi:hypothetical protein
MEGFRGGSFHGFGPLQRVRLRGFHMVVLSLGALDCVTWRGSPRGDSLEGGLMEGVPCVFPSRGCPGDSWTVFWRGSPERGPIEGSIGWGSMETVR